MVQFNMVKPGKRTPLWLSSIMKKEMRYLNDILHGMEPTEEFVKLLTGEAARAAIATADAMYPFSLRKPQS